MTTIEVFRRAHPGLVGSDVLNGVGGGLGGVDLDGVHLRDSSQSDGASFVEKVEFDVAVTESSAHETSGGGGLDVLSLAKLDAKSASKIEHNAVNRIRFSVPVLFAGQITHPKL